MKIVGNDISSFQGNVDFNVYKNNSNFLIIKASEGTGFKDPKFIRNQSEARRVNLPLGYYHFARPDLHNSAEAEANWFLTVVGVLHEGEVLVLDYEPNWPGGDAVTWCKKWLDTVFDLTQCRPLIYLNQSQTKQFKWKPVVDANYGLWIAAYTGSPDNNTADIGSWPFAAMQQWTNSQIVPGISGKVDGDVFFGSAETFKKYGFKTPVSPSTPPIPAPTPVVIVTTVPASTPVVVTTLPPVEPTPTIPTPAPIPDTPFPEIVSKPPLQTVDDFQEKFNRFLDELWLRIRSLLKL